MADTSTCDVTARAEILDIKQRLTDAEEAIVGKADIIHAHNGTDYIGATEEQLAALDALAEALEENGDVMSAYALANHTHSGYATTSYVDNAVADVDVDLTGYATETYVDKQIDAIDIPEVDLTGYATENYVLTEIARVQTGDAEVNLDGFATEDWVEDQIDAIDLSNYYTKTEVDSAISSSSGTGSGIGKVGKYTTSEIFNDYTSNRATGTYSHAEGCNTKALGDMGSHAEGCNSEASGAYSHAEGMETYADGEAAHAEGASTQAHGYASHAEGQDTCAAGMRQHVEGWLNIVDNDNRYIHIAGNGKRNGDNTYTRSNAYTLDWDGNAWFAGNVYIGGTSIDDASVIGTGGSVNLTNYYTKSQVDDLIDGIETSGGTVDLSDYYTKSQVDALIPDEVDLTNYYTKTEVDTKIESIETTGVDLSGYYTKTQVDALVSGYQTESQVQALIDASLGVIENGSY